MVEDGLAEGLLVDGQEEGDLDGVLVGVTLGLALGMGDDGLNVGPRLGEVGTKEYSQEYEFICSCQVNVYT